MTITVAVCSLPPFNAETWGCDMNIVSGNEHGFTLIEALMAVFVLSFGLMAMNALQVTSIQKNHTAGTLTEASVLASAMAERMLAMPYNSGTNGRDDDGDGLVDENDEQFEDGNGIHDVDERVDIDGDGTPDLYLYDGFGKNYEICETGCEDIDTSRADGSYKTPDGKYTILWNVAPDKPTQEMKTVGMKTVQFLVSNNFGKQKKVSITVCKIDL